MTLLYLVIAGGAEDGHDPMDHTNGAMETTVIITLLNPYKDIYLVLKIIPAAENLILNH
jgi:hypothetical protein